MEDLDKCYVSTTKLPAPECVMVIFGASGDLTKRLLLPTICHLGGHGLLSNNFSVVGVADKDHDDHSFQQYLLEDVAEKVKNKEAADYGKNFLSKKVHYVQGRFEEEQVFIDLKAKLIELNKTKNASLNYIFYLAVPPSMFLTVILGLHKAGLLNEDSGHFRRVVIEKPFGHDLASAIALNRAILQLISEHQIFRIDHYLGKETVQNLLAFRFANGIFEPIWDRRHIDHIQITVAESTGIEMRGNYYDHAGALRDMVPNHLFQLLSLIAMEPPISFESQAVRDEKAKLLRSIKCFSQDDVRDYAVRGQYDAGEIDNKSVNAYRNEAKVDAHSNTESFVALKLLINNWRWDGIPFYLRTGKRLKRRVSEVAIFFNKAPSIMFEKTKTQELSANVLVLHIQPEEGISLSIGAKIPGPSLRIGDVKMRFRYEDYFGLIKSGTGYETLLYDCMMGDTTLYQRADMVESAWRVVQPILDEWDSSKLSDLAHYEAGSSGPKEAELLLKKDGRSWRNL